MMIAALLLLLAALLVIVVQFYSAFLRFPIQASIRALVGLLTLLVATLGIPSLEGVITLSLDWGDILILESTDIKVTTATSIHVHALAWIGITILLSICFFRAPLERGKGGE